ncbi:MAG: hypothetical protein FJ123_00895 [Deltaproteobacteria bacterium]|nr:hypothetical protein [Deltaproteobacteria bacterium]
MKFGDLPTRIQHDVSGGRREQIGCLLMDLRTFSNFCRAEAFDSVYWCLDRLSTGLRQILNSGAITGSLSNGVQQLAQEIEKANLSSVEPDFLFETVDVYRHLESPFFSFGVLIPESLIGEVLVAIMKKKYGLIRDYSRAHRVGDLIKQNKTILVCGPEQAMKVYDSFCPASRIICIGYRRIFGKSFRKTFTLPLVLEELWESL